MSEILSLIAPIKLLPRRMQAVGGVVALLSLPVAWPLEVAGAYAYVVGTTLRQRGVRYGLIATMMAVAVIFEGFWLHQSWLFVAGGASQGAVHAKTAQANDNTGSVAGAETDDGLMAQVDGLQGSVVMVQWHGKTVGIRLLGVVIPSAQVNGHVECYGQEATGFLSTMVAGQTVKLQADAAVANTDSSGNLQRYVFLSNGTLLNQLMLSQGDAHLDDSLSNYQYYSVFAQAQRQAQAGKTGLWATCPDSSDTPTPTPSNSPTPTGEVKGVSQLLAHPQPGPSPTPSVQMFGSQPIPNVPSATNTPPTITRTPSLPTSTPNPTPSPSLTPSPTPSPTSSPTPTPAPSADTTPTP